ncbi:MAG TPA: hypothetical protein ENN98_05700 [Desulfurivibrio alkaliphilus]|uniref:Pilus assembly protein PilP n=1 Tax=Desulfurivibrio alkaliphilus TaxID=427923 RepID=A0A7C2XRN1_9BACT|nr:hypothetical protein [Desulfurivibrio alkaliphilus]
MALNIGKSGGISALFVLLLLLCPGAGLSESREESPGEELSRQPPLSLLEELQLSPDPFFYRQTGRPDPFMPFVTIRPAATAAGKPDKAEAEEVLTGLRRFEPEQLTLTAIVLSDKASLAMVEDSTGYGHIIRRGSSIGRSGRVERITADRVIIRQELVTLTGEQEYRTVELVLMREGEDK